VATPPTKLQAIGDYDLLAQIGEGGAGVVYKARHRQTEAIVAVKLLHAQQANNQILLRRFEQEFRAARPLSHPHLVQMFDFQQIEGTPILVMEYIEGRSLGERLELSGRLPLAEATAVIAQVALALDWLHDQGIVHRDVKPDNIIVSPDGLAKLTDLGLVKERLFDQSLTRTGSALGTPNFMAPEQFRDAKNVDRRCDVYSLGATFYQMVTGEIPFRQSSPFDAWMQKTKNEFDPPKKFVPDLPESVDAAIRRAMNGDAAARPGTCQEFVNELSRVAQPEKPADTWELVFENAGEGSEPLRADTASVRQLLKGGRLQGMNRVSARRSPTDPFEPLERFAEFRDLVTEPSGAIPVVADVTPSPPPSPVRKPEAPEHLPAAPQWAVVAATLALAILGFIVLRNLLR
jgi:serine/threonine protein kinase